MKSVPAARSGQRRFTAILLLTALVATSCVAARASEPVGFSQPNHPAPASASPASEAPTALPSAYSTTYALFVSDPPTAEPTPTASLTAPTAVVDPLPSVPPAPVGNWKSIQWTALPPTPAFGASGQAGSTFQAFGWSRGYVGFTLTPNESGSEVEPPEPTVVSSYSTDGVHWHSGQTLDPKAAGSFQLQVFRSVIEGPTGLLAVGWTGGCASEYLDSLWTSADGMSWQPVDARKAFGAVEVPIAYVSGGAAGYVAVAYRGAGVWTSTDGQDWQRVDLGAAPFESALVNDGTAMSGGFVLAGTKGTSDCGAFTYEGTPPPPVFRTATAWWSVDGSTWTRAALPGAVSSSEHQNIWACHLNDRATLVVDDISGGDRLAWASSNGQTWVPVSLPKDVDRLGIVSGAQRNVIVESTATFDKPGDLHLSTVDDTLAVVQMTWTGVAPHLDYSTWGSYGMVAVGPTGLVVASSGGGQLWFGTPSV